LARPRSLDLSAIATLLAVVMIIAARDPATSAEPAHRGRAGTAQTPIKHIVFVFKENRSYDSYFGSFPGADGATSATCKTAGGVRTIDPLPITPDPMPNDLGHSPEAFEQRTTGGRWTASAGRAAPS